MTIITPASDPVEQGETLGLPPELVDREHILP
jgi:hypothetical protein